MPPGTQVSRFRCPGCSAGLEFDPTAAAMKCPYCGSSLEVEKIVPETGLLTVQEHPFAEGLDPSTFRKVSDAALEITCSGCGAAVVFEPPLIAGSCSFCSAKLIAQPKDPDPLLAPDGLLPFSVPKETATTSVRRWLSSRWFAPNALKDVAKPEGIHGVYIPFWTFDAATRTRYRGERGIYYFEQVREGNQIRQVRRTQWSPASGEVELSFDDVLVPATRSVNARRLSELDPWDLDAVTSYEPAYLAGFQAQRYQIGVEQGFELSKTTMNATIEQAACKQIGGDEQRILQTQTDYTGVTFKHLLLPVWLGAYRFQGKVFQVAVNARTGEVQGERPYRAIKIILFIAVLLVILLLIAQSR